MTAHRIPVEVLREVGRRGESVKPCPLCGSDVQLNVERYAITNALAYWAECRNPDCLACTGAEPTLELAIAVWEMRGETNDQ